MMAILGQGVYTFAEAAKLAGLRPARVREWFRGGAKGAARKPIFLGDYEPVDGDYALSFHDLIDVLVAGQLREHGVSLRTLRLVCERLKLDLGTRHPFCRKELATDGKIVFLHAIDGGAREELSEVLTRRRVFPRILAPSLKKIDYDQATNLARRWRIADGVVVDPAIGFGKPIVERSGITTYVLARAYHANQKDAERVADWYGIDAGQVLSAVAFESDLAA
jgi:uncharacterized protein (DUF433 family)